jgi:hypothetical protein
VRYEVRWSSFQRSTNILVSFKVYSAIGNYEMHLTEMLMVVPTHFLACFLYFTTKNKAVRRHPRASTLS